MNADVYQRHMRQMRQLILQHNAPSAKPDVNKLAQDLRNLGVGEKEAQAGLLTVGQRDQLGIRDGDLEKIGGKENLFRTLRLLELQDIQDGQNAKLLLANRPQAVIRQQGPAIPVAKKPETRPQSNIIIPTVPQVRTGGLDERADLDDYTIYDEGMLNDYCIMKAQNEAKHVAQAGLDQNADFDDYTIYDEGKQ
ncbi:hypothetical protein EB796_003066 [Bugula neritina]|uniref:Uncharacterized protein n=1 Tax=Bugula neritina TaxID=10212 RepID=A0A7J7KIT3_BUGNE|nr:hypothetical protein EB796_003066 [Bugula neritina]